MTPPVNTTQPGTELATVPRGYVTISSGSLLVQTNGDPTNVDFLKHVRDALIRWTPTPAFAAPVTIRILVRIPSPPQLEGCSAAHGPWVPNSIGRHRAHHVGSRPAVVDGVVVSATDSPNRTMP